MIRQIVKVGFVLAIGRTLLPRLRRSTKATHLVVDSALRNYALKCSTSAEIARRDSQALRALGADTTAAPDSQLSSCLRCHSSTPPDVLVIFLILRAAPQWASQQCSGGNASGLKRSSVVPLPYPNPTNNTKQKRDGPCRTHWSKLQPAQL